MKTILHSVHIHAAPPKVYEALTAEEGIKNWWTANVKVETGEGGVIRFAFGGDFNPHMKQVSLQPARRVEWKCVAGHENWTDNTFVFALEERKGETMLKFAQYYAQELSDEVYGIYNFNWGYYLNSLKQFCEKGVGVPYVPHRASGSPL